MMEIQRNRELSLLADALHRARPTRKRRAVRLAAGVVVLAGIGAALPEIGGRQTEGSALAEVLAGGRKAKDIRTITVGTQARLVFSKNIADRAAVGDEQVLGYSVLGKRELLLLGRTVGRTTLTTWFEDGTIEQFLFSVQRDLSILDTALRQIHPGIVAEIAPDRDAIVLTGTVPDRSYSIAAQNAAASYLSAGARSKPGDGAATQPGEVAAGAEPRSSAQVINLIRWESEAADLETVLQQEIARHGGSEVHVTRVQRGSLPDDAADVFVVEGSMPDMRALAGVGRVLDAMLDCDKQVVNRLEVAGREMDLAGVIERAIREDLGCPKVNVRRVTQVEFRDESDILVLQGRVPTQTKLTQALTLASRMYLQQDLVKRKLAGEFEEVTDVLPSGETRTTRRPLKLKEATEDIVVAANESGALVKDTTQLGTALGRLRAGTSGDGASGSTFGRLLTNDIEANIGRAKALELAEGRILSFLEVEDLPQVRVDITLVEINRTALLNWDSEFSSKVTDFDQPSSLRPANLITLPDGTQVLDPNAPPTDNADFQNLLSFLGGELSEGFFVSGAHVDIKAVFDLLESEGLGRTLSSPSLTVLSGELAAFGVGGEIPIEETTFAGTGVATGSVTFKDFGVGLAVRPLVGEDDFITIDLVPEVSNPDADLTADIRQSSGTNPPTTAFASRVLRTTSRLRDGQSLLIGGLTEHSRIDQSSQTPWLHRIPLLGFLFKDFGYADGDRELVIVVHPVIVRDEPDEAQLWAFPEAMELLDPNADQRKEASREAQ